MSTKFDKCFTLQIDINSYKIMILIFYYANVVNEIKFADLLDVFFEVIWLIIPL